MIKCFLHLEVDGKTVLGGGIYNFEKNIILEVTTILLKLEKCLRLRKNPKIIIYNQLIIYWGGIEHDFARRVFG